MSSSTTPFCWVMRTRNLLIYFFYEAKILHRYHFLFLLLEWHAGFLLCYKKWYKMLNFLVHFHQINPNPSAIIINYSKKVVRTSHRWSLITSPYITMQKFKISLWIYFTTVKGSLYNFSLKQESQDFQSKFSTLDICLNFLIEVCPNLWCQIFWSTLFLLAKTILSC